MTRQLLTMIDMSVSRSCQSLVIIIIYLTKTPVSETQVSINGATKIANMLSETVYTGITNLYIITENQQNIKQYIINVNSVF